MSISNEWNKSGEAVCRGGAPRRSGTPEIAFEKTERVTGRSSDGEVVFTVDLSGVAFLPGSHGCSPHSRCWPADGHAAAVPDPGNGSTAGNIVGRRCSGRIEAEQRNELLANLKEGRIRGMVKNIIDYGARRSRCVDGLLHVTDIAWRRINHPTEALSIGQTAKVQVIRYNSKPSVFRSA